MRQIRALVSEFKMLAEGAPVVEKALRRFEKENRDLLSLVQPPHIHFAENSDLRIFSADSDFMEAELVQTFRNKPVSPRYLKQSQENRWEGQALRTCVHLNSSSKKLAECPCDI